MPSAHMEEEIGAMVAAARRKHSPEFSEKRSMAYSAKLPVIGDESA